MTNRFMQKHWKIRFVAMFLLRTNEFFGFTFYTAWGGVGVLLVKIFTTK
jgi:hypothetical protein